MLPPKLNIKLTGERKRKLKYEIIISNLIICNNPELNYKKILGVLTFVP